MAFKKIQPPASVPDSPDKLFLDLPRRRIPDVLPHQREIMRLYAAEALDKPDVALQLPTGSGKTLVGLLIAEWRRRKNQERIVYLCPTRQLVNQAVEQAEEKYGLTVMGFTGPSNKYDPVSKSWYQNADRIAITTYTSVFNTNPYFDNADVIIVDDAHAAENYIAALWSVRVERLKPEHQGLHSALCIALKPLLDSLNYARLLGRTESIADQVWVDKIPTPAFVEIRDQIIEIFDTHTIKTDLTYPWSMVRSHLGACHLYLSTQEILVRPLIPPTWTHAPFADPKQRIYMSATLGAGGDLERLTGRRPINRLAIPSGWDRQGVGRRFFIFPGMSLREQDTSLLRSELMTLARRSLVLVPSNRLRDQIAAEVSDNLGFPVFSGNDIEESKKVFTEKSPAVAVVSNRYDGIDFPGDECRLLFVEGLPRATNLQERFLMSRMGAPLLFNERVQVRVLQAIGRCTRSLEDYSAVVVTGEELTDYLADIKRRTFFHPELQAELEFGVSQSKETDISSLVENFSIFLKTVKSGKAQTKTLFWPEREQRRNPSLQSNS
jgi:Rad3-related DNA helicase